MKETKKRGPKPNIEAIKQAKEYIASGLSYRQTMRKMNIKHLMTIYRWAHYVL